MCRTLWVFQWRRSRHQPPGCAVQSCFPVDDMESNARTSVMVPRFSGDRDSVFRNYHSRHHIDDALLI
jgi:hypothetical protein